MSTPLPPLPMLPSDCASLIASFSSDRRSYACVSKQWRFMFSSSDSCWKSSLFGDFQSSNTNDTITISPCRQRGKTTMRVKDQESYEKAWREWRNCERKRGGRFVRPQVWLRAVTMMDSFRGWNDGRGLNLKMRPGRDVVDVWSNPLFGKDEFVTVLGESIRAIWGTHDGQHSGGSPLFGAISAYDMRAETYFAPLLGNWKFDSLDLRIAFGLNPFAITAEEGLCPSYEFKNRKIIMSSLRDDSRTFEGDGVLIFFETFVKDIITYGRSFLDRNEKLYMWVFPLRGRRTSVAVTEGIRVHVSYEEMPLAANPYNAMWVYEITIDVVPDEAQRWVKNTTLVTRHWEFQSPLAQQPPEIVDGEGVIGFQPVFDEHGNVSPSDYGRSFVRGPFVYRSCVRARSGTMMQGHFTFSSTDAKGLALTFNARVAPLNFTRSQVFMGVE